ncbi:bacteriophage protein [Neoasaia chiangmaiensis NBRC 101099]|uniref:Uncharacterized protein n=1 Tax=Neoasaia chiangmaiensis TaxID=320497 RepID=A0A1U9KR24_9PROT|nr:baseplate J/gp47 family protein [Neoasaia chiangmaiensis]AQS88278.1 hypothetical protein A0U93_10360 [Neoasaia chiangmaiensis]GBR39670.1 bacteriophage protein [Neoasaia chiangmaiensis NBRC 101099]GEN14688.1 hypothetical protein NCH01_11190 [Neoasaia chiangmaiensis]
MAYQRPTLAQLRQQALQDVLNGGIPNVVAVLRFSVLYVLCMVLAGLANLHYGYLDWIARQAVPWTATGIFLEGWAALKGKTRQAATAASGSVTFVASGTDVIPPGTTVQITGGLSATTTADSVTANGSTVAACTMGATGAAGNLAVGAVATLGSPVPGVQSVGVVSAPFTGGADIETDDSLRNRMLDAFAEGGQNGAADDYEGWALDVPGVTRVWVNPLGFGAGTVVVYIMLDNAEAANGGFPQGTDGTASKDPRYVTASGDQLTVADAIYAVRPVTALVIVCAPVAQPVNFTISSLGSNNTSATQALITDALADMFTRLSSPGGTIYPNQWNEAIAALGLSQFNVSSPSGPVTGVNAGAMPTLGTVQCSA